jgi:hypothetical protein
MTAAIGARNLIKVDAGVVHTLMQGAVLARERSFQKFQERVK